MIRTTLAATAFAALIGFGASAQAAPGGHGYAHRDAPGKHQLQLVDYRGCSAVGVTINGRRIPGVAGHARGPNACGRALRECNRELNFRQRRGGNPFGRCIVR